MKRFDVLTIFPDIVNSYLSASILGRAQAKKFIEVHSWDIRQFTTDKHRTVDDTPYGGGAGMVMKIEPIDLVLQEIGKSVDRSQQHIIVLSARGKKFTQAKARQLAAAPDNITLICGRYEGIDQRVVDHLADEELSVGDYVLAGGELPALIVIEAIARLQPNVLGNPESLSEESHAKEGTIEYPQYTKPDNYKGWQVPDILLSGNHKAINEWRQEQSRRSGTTGDRI